MQKLTELLTGDMGGHAAYVWPSYTLAAVVMIVMAFASVRAWSRASRAFARISEGNEA